MPGDDYTAGLTRAIETLRSLAQLARNCGQDGAGPDALEAAAKVLEAEVDGEETPPAGVTICEVCGGVRRVQS